MDIVGLIIIGVAILSLLPLFFVLYVLFADLFEENQPSAWDRIRDEELRTALSSTVHRLNRSKGAYRQACDASSEAYFQVKLLSATMFGAAASSPSTSDLVLERESVAAWQSITCADEHAEISFCLFTRRGQRVLLTHRLWMN